MQETDQAYFSSSCGLHGAENIAKVSSTITICSITNNYDSRAYYFPSVSFASVLCFAVGERDVLVLDHVLHSKHTQHILQGESKKQLLLTFQLCIKILRRHTLTILHNRADKNLELEF